MLLKCRLVHGSQNGLASTGVFPGTPGPYRLFTVRGAQTGFGLEEQDRDRAGLDALGGCDSEGRLAQHLGAPEHGPPRCRQGRHRGREPFVPVRIQVIFQGRTIGPACVLDLRPLRCRPVPEFAI